jgi:hypothetical protein
MTKIHQIIVELIWVVVASIALTILQKLVPKLWNSGRALFAR